MDYFRLINLNKEPFSNSPDPDLFFQARVHAECLQKLELSLRLRRGLSVVMGDVGTGKTTLCRELIRRFGNDDKLETHLILDPSFSSSHEFLTTITQMLIGTEPLEETSELEKKETIKNYLFQKGVDEQKIVILIIDEGQKLPDSCLEILREFLNYETNAYKLLQIVIFAQTEFEQVLARHTNFSDRVNWAYTLSPLNFQETRAMIRYRLERTSGGRELPSFFSFLALWVVYRASKGYPRKIIHLCHRILLTLIIQKRSKAGWMVARSCADRVFPYRRKRWQWIWATAIGCLGTMVILIILGLGSLPSLSPWAGGERQGGKRTDFRSVAAKKSEPAPTFKAPIVASVKRSEGSSKNDLKEMDLQRQNDVNHVASIHNPQDTPSVRPPEYPSKKALKQETKSYPKFLGQLALSRKETLGDLIHKIYGLFNRQYLETVSKANPEIEDPNVLLIGDVIQFPTIPLPMKPEALDFWWVVISQKDTLEEAYNFLKRYDDVYADMYMIPHWSKRKGLNFIFAHKKHFDDKQSARESLKSLPPPLLSEAKIMKGWESGTIFFANPILRSDFVQIDAIHPFMQETASPDRDEKKDLE